jgi:hypothetical protein
MLDAGMPNTLRYGLDGRAGGAMLKGVGVSPDVVCPPAGCAGAVVGVWVCSAVPDGVWTDAVADRGCPAAGSVSGAADGV